MKALFPASPVLLLLLAGCVARTPPVAPPPEPAVEPATVAVSPPPTPPPPPPPPVGALPVEPLIVAVPEAAGPPALGCDEALGRVPKPAPHPPSTSGAPSGPPHVAPDPAAMPQVTVDGTPAEVASLPGADVEALPPQPLEGAPEVLAAIGAVLARAEAGQRVRLSFYGASHTAGEFWTGHLRRLLQTRYGDVGHGFVLPAALYKGDRAQDVNLCRTEGWQPDWAGRREGHGDGLLGPGGMSVSSSDPADFGWLETTRSNPQGRAVAFFDVYALAQPGGGTLLLTVDAAAPREVSTAAEAPDLLRFRVEVPDGPHRLTLAPAGDGEVRLFGVSMERPGPGVLVDAMGVRGKEARTWLAWDEGMAARGLASLDPDLVVLAYGTNEANDARYELDAYRADLRAVLARLHAAVPGAACLLVGPSDRFMDLKHDRYAIWDRTAGFAQVQREVALASGCAFWDWQQASGGPGSMLAWRLHEPALGSKDGIHFTRAGYELSAERLLEAMDGVR
ncbi:MAG: GDSL-type esterase/lipase family protein [Pseudomonadota bacterium]